MTNAGPDQHLVTEIRAAYEGSAERWATGPAALYRCLADALVEAAPERLAGERVLDLGAGTGVASEALLAAGARPIGADLALGMLAHGQPHRPPGVVGDAQTLPFRDGAFAAVIAAFSLNHVPDPQVALRECRRVIRAGGLVLASTFPTDDEHPAKAVVESVLEEFGYQRPPWYETFKTRVAARTGDRDAILQAAIAAGLGAPRVDRIEVEVGLDNPEVAVEWRLNMPHTVGFMSGLDPPTQAALRARATMALPARLPPSVAMLALRAQLT